MDAEEKWLIALYVLYFVVATAFWAAVIGIVAHFIGKWW